MTVRRHCSLAKVFNPHGRIRNLNVEALWKHRQMKKIATTWERHSSTKGIRFFLNNYLFMFCSTDEKKQRQCNLSILYRFSTGKNPIQTLVEWKENPNMCFAFFTVYFDNSVILQNCCCIFIASPSSDTCKWWILKPDVSDDNLFNLSMKWCWQILKTVPN